ncbi:MAG: hypothetical protein ACPG8V_01745 [Alphaproteobacteria bacterium]
MIIKILNPIVKFTYRFWGDNFVICPYVNNEAKYMAKGVKPFTALADDERFLQDYYYPYFDPLVKQGVVIEQKTQKPFKKKSGENIIFTKVYYYYPGEQWRIERWEYLQNNYLKYTKSCPIREGLLLGYPKKYIRRHRLNSKIGNWLCDKGFMV